MSTAKRLEDLAIAYAKNRTELYENSRAIRSLHNDVDAYIDMKPFRDRFYEGEWLDDQAVLRWNGWLYAVEALYAHDDKHLDEDDAYRAMAILLDERKTIRQRGNSLKSRLRQIGQSLLKDSP